MKLPKKMLLFIPYFFSVNIGCALLLQDWNYSMLLFTLLYAALIGIPMVFIVVFVWKNRATFQK